MLYDFHKRIKVFDSGYLPAVENVDSHFFVRVPFHDVMYWHVNGRWVPFDFSGEGLMRCKYASPIFT